MDIPILWSDQNLLVIDKPAGLLSIPDGYDPTLPHLKSELMEKYGRLWIVHRLDRYTSGVMLVARSAETHQALNTQFQNREVKKTYAALVDGCPEWDQKLVEVPLRINAGKRHRTVVDVERGKPSATHFRVLERFEHFCLVDARPDTGRRHQVRAHLSNAGYPITCDSLYGSQRVIHGSDLDAQFSGEIQPGEVVLERTALHASSIEFMHPVSGKKFLIAAPLAADMQRTLSLLRK